jgi:hypothetical protein
MFERGDAECVDPSISMKDLAAAPRDEPGMAADFMVELRKGSFTDIEAANRHVNATLLRNRNGVDRVVEGKSSRAALDALFGWETGREAFVTGGQTEPQIRETYGVRVVIVAYRQIPRGYRVHTAFPRNFYPAPAPSKTQMDIYNSTGVEVTYDWRTDENFARAKEFLKDMVGAPTSADLHNPNKPWFYYFETPQEDEALREFIRRLRRGPR